MQSFAVTFGSSRPCAQKMPENVLGSDEVTFDPKLLLGVFGVQCQNLTECTFNIGQ